MSSWPDWDMSMRDDDRDDLIDTTAYAMTRGEPTPQLRTTVRAHIERSQAPWPLWGKVAMAGAAALLLIVIAGRDLRDQREALPPAPQLATVKPVDVPRPTERAAERERPEQSERPERPQRSITPILIEPIVVPLMAVETSSGVMPIDIDPLQVEPLQPE